MIRIRRRIVPLSVLKEGIDRRAKVALLDRAEARFIRQEMTIADQQKIINAHLAFLEDLTMRQDHLSPFPHGRIDFRQEFTEFFLNRHGRPVITEKETQK